MTWRPAAIALAGALLAAAPADGCAAAPETKTLKEQLSDKASDAQRVDNCNVPEARRGSVPRPGCPGEDAAAGGQAGSGARAPADPGPQNLGPPNLGPPPGG